MHVRSFVVGMGVPFIVACGARSGTPVAPRSPTAEEHPARAGSPSARAPAPSAKQSRPTAQTNELEASELDGRAAVTRQVEALERAIELYQAFIERAGNDPTYAQAVERSRNRIEDARLTICFLLEKPCDEPGR